VEVKSNKLALIVVTVKLIRLVMGMVVMVVMVVNSAAVGLMLIKNLCRMILIIISMLT
jgi:hypothetical protein